MGAPTMTETTAASPPPPRVRPDKPRELIAGPSDQPAAPFPVYLSGCVQRGFGRGGRDLGCPTANFPDEVIEPYADSLESGVYYGFARVKHERSPASASDEVHPMVMSIGWNPYYKNVRRTAEVHILHDYGEDFYGEYMSAVVLGFIRPEYDYNSLDALVDDINTDKKVAAASVARPSYETFARDPFFDQAVPNKRTSGDNDA